MSITRKEFERLFFAELLATSFEDTSIGDIWYKRGFITNRHLVPLLNNIAMVCNDEALLNLEKGVALINANIPNIDVTDDFKSDSSLSIPTLDVSLKGVVSRDKIVNMSFTNVMGKNGTSIRAAVTTAVNKLKDEKFDTYKDRIRNTEVIMGLFYSGAVSLSVEKDVTVQADIEARIGAIPGVTIHTDTTDNNVTKFTISNAASPFAALFIPGRDL